MGRHRRSFGSGGVFLTGRQLPMESFSASSHPPFFADSIRRLPICIRMGHFCARMVRFFQSVHKLKAVVTPIPLGISSYSPCL